ncbi:MAG: hypothetical protein E7812_05525 [Phenylobacterium sp.]|nr:MAG: hypothetical protein E7812_05525 [Phenylobacterium sp.]
MAKFLAIYTGQPGAGGPPDPATIAKGMQAWTDWMSRHASQVVEGGGPLGKTKRVTKAGVADAQNTMAGYVIVEADDHAAAAKMFEGHPHFAIFPGDGVDVMPVMPIPGA